MATRSAGGSVWIVGSFLGGVRFELRGAVFLWALALFCCAVAFAFAEFLGWKGGGQLSE